MTIKKTYIKRVRISASKFHLIVSCFCRDFTAYHTSILGQVNRHTVEHYFGIFRSLIFFDSFKEEERVNGEIEIDEAYFGPSRVRGKRGRGAGKKVPVIGLLKRNGKVFTKIVKNCKKESLIPIIKGRILTGSTVYTDSWKSYDGLILYGYKHKRIHHAKNEFARGKNHVNGIESFWSFVKRRLQKFNGVRKDKFLLYLKESEWRFNNRGMLEKSLISLLKIKSYSY